MLLKGVEARAPHILLIQQHQAEAARVSGRGRVLNVRLTSPG